MRARWPMPLETPPEKWIGRFALPIPDAVWSAYVLKRATLVLFDGRQETAIVQFYDAETVGLADGTGRTKVIKRSSVVGLFPAAGAEGAPRRPVNAPALVAEARVRFEAADPEVPPEISVDGGAACTVPCEVGVPAGLRVVTVKRAGKFCLVGAATRPARFTGLEARAGLVQVARDLARRLGLPNAQFVRADLRTAPLGRYQGLYLYDPFSEATAEEDERLDPCVPTGDRAADVATLLGRLEGAAPGTRLAMFCGLGGPEPEGWRLAAREAMNPRGDELSCWIKP